MNASGPTIPSRPMRVPSRTRADSPMLVSGPMATSRSMTAVASTRAVGSITCRLLLVGRVSDCGRTASISPTRAGKGEGWTAAPTSTATPEQAQGDAGGGSEGDRPAPVEHGLDRALDPAGHEQE